MKKTKLNLFFKLSGILLCLLVFAVNELSAIPAITRPILYTQPDGSQLSYLLHGDEYHHFKTTLDGYRIVQNEEGYFVYEIMDENGTAVATDVVARNQVERTTTERSFLSQLSMDWSRYDAATHQAKRQQRQPKQATKGKRKAYPLSGSPKALVILVNFSDKSFVVDDPQTAFSDLLNQKNYSQNGGTGSAKDYFEASSNGLFSPQFDIYGPFDLPNNMSYYGANDYFGDDKNPQQMVKEACGLALAAGVNFADYDTDNDGFVDNVFIYYAGNNEAEGGPLNSIWPHRWATSDDSSDAPSFGGKKVWDYACTSELRGIVTSASNMCGIGTFAHEFSHVLGLPDYYCTVNSSDCPSTPRFWSLMDVGSYLNDGRTPPTYSAYDRFFLGWSEPDLLTRGTDASLEHVLTSNKSYLIAESTHNLNGANPSPAEFFILENRTKTAWDAYLPDEGLLIWHIDYNASAWEGNEVNNYSPAKVELHRADGIYGSDYSDLTANAFPSGTTDFFNPTLNDETDLNKPITAITFVDNVVEFKFMGGLVESPSLAECEVISAELEVFQDGKILKVFGTEPSFIVQLLDSDQKLVKDVRMYKAGKEIDISELESGSYVVKVMNKQSAKYLRFEK